MRVLRTILLVILMPCLMVPGGLAFRVCLCGDDCPSVTSCCATPATDAPPTPIAAELPACCCSAIVTAEQPPSTTPGAHGFDLAPTAAITIARAEWPPPPSIEHALCASARAPPPRAAERNLPLLL